VSEALGAAATAPIALSLQADDFTLLGLPRAFAIDRADLDERWKALQRQVHPDRFAAQGAAAQRLAMQWSVRVNEAYNRLKDPLQRAAYWCELQGMPVQAHSNTAMPAEFLLQQMAWREALDDALATPQPAPAIEALLEQAAADRRQRLAVLGHLIDEQADAAAAVQQVRALMFVERFTEDLHRRLD
jgi:molecular chaperone HscB